MFACLFCPTMPDGVSLADFAYAFSPLVEETAVDTVVIDTEGCELIFGSAYELANEIANTARRPKGTGGLGCKINVAIAGNLDTAIYAARFFKGITFISPGEELTALGDLPVTELSPKSKVQSPKSWRHPRSVHLWRPLRDASTLHAGLVCSSRQIRSRPRAQAGRFRGPDQADRQLSRLWREETSRKVRCT